MKQNFNFLEFSLILNAILTDNYFYCICLNIYATKNSLMINFACVDNSMFVVVRYFLLSAPPSCSIHDQHIKSISKYECQQIHVVLQLSGFRLSYCVPK